MVGLLDHVIVLCLLVWNLQIMLHKYMSTETVFNPLPGFVTFCPFRGEVVSACDFLVFITYAFSQLKLENQRIYSFESRMFIFHVDSETLYAVSWFSLLFLTQLEYLSCFICFIYTSPGFISVLFPLHFLLLWSQHLKFIIFKEKIQFDSIKRIFIAYYILVALSSIFSTLQHWMHCSTRDGEA